MRKQINKKSVTVGLLTFNEAENLKILIPQIKKELSSLNIDYDIKIIDAKKTTDKTKEICKKEKVEYYEQPGFGQADAMRYAIQLVDKDLFLILDADCSHNPIYIPKIYKKFVDENFDIVIGSRYINGGSTDDKMTSIIMSKILNSVMRVVMGMTNIKDISGGYRLYDSKQIKNIKLSAENFEMQQEILMRMKINNPKLKIGEVPIHFEQRKFGKSTRKLLLYIWCYFKNIFKMLKLRFAQI